MTGSPLSALERELIDSAHRALADAVSRLFALRGAAVHAAAQTDWQADAARAFHASAEDWSGEIDRLAHVAALARDDVWRLRARAHDAAGATLG